MNTIQKTTELVNATHHLQTHITAHFVFCAIYTTIQQTSCTIDLYKY